MKTFVTKWRIVHNANGSWFAVSDNTGLETAPASLEQTLATIRDALVGWKMTYGDAPS